MTKIKDEQYYFIVYNKDQGREIKLLTFKESKEHKLASKFYWFNHDEANGKSGAEAYLRYKEGIR